jgi:hypothetical protein
MKAFDEHLDPLLWAKRPKSQSAMDLLIRGVKQGGDPRLAEIYSGHLSDGVCDESGNLLRRWDGLRWTSDYAI